LIPAFQNIHIIYKIYDSLFYKGTIATTYFVTNPPPNPRKEKNLKIAFAAWGFGINNEIKKTMGHLFLHQLQLQL
jgi:hypothetical protein